MLVVMQKKNMMKVTPMYIVQIQHVHLWCIKTNF